MASTRWAMGIGVVALMATGMVRAQTVGIPGQAVPAITAGANMTDQEFRRGAYPTDAQGLVAPRAIQRVMAKYTSDAMRAKIQGIVTVEAVVMPDGTVGRVRVKDSLDKSFGLDDQALIAAAQWTFQPGTLNGQAVPVLVTFTQEFRLH